MADNKDKYTREEAVEVFSEMSRKIQKEKKWWRWTEIVTMLSGTTITVLATVSMELVQSKEMFEQILKKPNLLTYFALLTSTVILITFMPSFFKWITNRNSRQDISLKKRVIKTYLEQLDKTIINPSTTTQS